MQPRFWVGEVSMVASSSIHIHIGLVMCAGIS